ncbi:hypothetical protein CLV24_1273 [Pontibacter ummariensis]|uniref:Uncharacterized protein n=1 Tax=Pontibacter ummariensis TaxID=1610492 RepID=A0A239KD51_9BACT|nr:hypothetical protein [Pontibacter ummariensis]PRY06384.1 hypothetical protein CLV24_1273 [Pontibacter ummariensis]SNT16277.1 hypothetical protein SAMN06296052_1283 [Pontibacter ummariensis]
MGKVDTEAEVRWRVGPLTNAETVTETQPPARKGDVLDKPFFNIGTVQRLLACLALACAMTAGATPDGGGGIKR